MDLLRAIRIGFRASGGSAILMRCSRRTLFVGQSLNRLRFVQRINQRCFASSEDQPKKEPTGKRSSDGAPMTWGIFAIAAVAGAVVIYFTQKMKKEKDQQIAAEIAKHTKSIGKSLIGGPWELVNYDNKPMSWRDYLGKWVIIYFGFTHCPDICPEELEKLINVVNKLKKDPKMPTVHPLFFTVDPYRDTPQGIKQYCQEFSPDLMGFSGTVEQVKKVCKTFRVYFSEGPKMDNDYIVDHSIIMYLINPEGEYVEHYSRETPERRMEIKVRKQIEAYEAQKNS